MFGAGLIKLRGDPCWRDLTCLDYYFETQPMPNGLSWFFHWMPAGVHRTGVLVNHAVELVVPFFYFGPQPIASVAAALTIAFQLALIVSGNLSWLNWLTLVLCVPLIEDRWWSWIPVTAPSVPPAAPAYRMTIYVLAIGVALLSIRPMRNLLSPTQMMNFSFNPLHLVNTYGAFGSITRTRYEIVVEGTDDAVVTDQTQWKEYEFKGKPGNPMKRPRQFAPYHLRLDWLMWFAAMPRSPRNPWFATFVGKVLDGDRDAIGLLEANPFPNRPPRYVRALYYRYRFTTSEERRATGAWWKRDLVGEYLRPVSLSLAGNVASAR
jgi:hypothetical protein